MKLTFVFAVLLLASSLTSAEEREFKSTSATKATVTYERAVEDAEREYEEKVAELQKELAKKMTNVRTEYVAALEVEKTNSTKAGDLDEALKIRSKIESIKEDQKRADENKGREKKKPLPRDILTQKLIGTVWEYDYPAKIVFEENGFGHHLGVKDRGWTWTAYGKNFVVVEYPNENINIFAFSDDLTGSRMFEYGGLFKTARRNFSGHQIKKE